MLTFASEPFIEKHGISTELSNVNREKHRRKQKVTKVLLLSESILYKLYSVLYFSIVFFCFPFWRELFLVFLFVPIWK